MEKSTYYPSSNERTQYKNSIDTIVLAAGKASRFNSDKSKLLFQLCGEPLLQQLLRTLQNFFLEPLLVLGHQEELIKAMLDKLFRTVTQKEQKGTADAVAIALPLVEKDHVLIINGDMPLISPEILLPFLKKHIDRDADITIATASTTNPKSYGRVIIGKNNSYIQEDKNCSPEEAACNIVNAGIYLFRTSILKKYIQNLKQDDQSGEFFLPDIINAAILDGNNFQTYQMPFDSIKGVNTLQDAHDVQAILQQKIIAQHIQNGVIFRKPETVTIDLGCIIKKNAIIEPGVIIKNRTTIAENSNIGAYSILDAAQINAHVTIFAHSIIKDSTIESYATVGPFAHVHTKSLLKESTRVGNFVEVKKSSLGTLSKAKHLSYLGDTEIGTKVNIGAGTITCNYDGFTKHKTIIHNNVSIGAQNALVAPVTIGQGAMTAAGSTITENIPEESLGIGRARQVNKEGYTRMRKESQQAKKNNVPITSHET